MSGIKVTGGIVVDGPISPKPSPVGTWDSLYDPQVDFNRDEFTALLHGKGYELTWSKAQFCPNRPKGGLDPRDHDIACRICGGDGWIYYDAIKTRMLVQGVRLDQAFHAWGRWDAGSVLVTALPEQRLSWWDKLTFHNSVCRFSEILRRLPGSLHDITKYTPLEVEQVSWVNRAGELRIATLGTHIQIATVAGTPGITWLDNTNRPDDDDYYTISYTFRPQYIVLNVLHQHRDSTIGGVHYEFPTQATAKLDFFVRDEAKDAPEVDHQNPFPGR